MSKKIRFASDILFINVLVIVLIVIIFLSPSNVLRIIIGLPFLLFFPGYTLIAVLFPKKNDLDAVERIALSFGLSIALSALIGFLLNYTPWGIRLCPILLSLSFFIFVTSIITYYRRCRLPVEECFIFSFKIGRPQWAGLSNIDKALTIVLILSILVTIGVLSYTIITPKAGERFTEFYILGPEGKAENYPHELMLGEEAILNLGIVNHEGQEMKYDIEVRIDGVEYKKVGSIVLADEEKWEKRISFIAQKVSNNQKIQFLLYKNEEHKPSETLHLFINVTQ